MRRIFMDNFEDILRWDSKANNATALVEISDVDSFRGGGCLHVKNIDDPPTNDGDIEVSVSAMLTTFKRFKISGELKFGTKTNILDLAVKLYITIENYVYWIGVKYDIENNVFYYIGKTGAWVKVFDSKITILAGTWFTFSFDVDVQNTRLTSVEIAGKTQDLKSRLYGQVAGSPDRSAVIYLNGFQLGTTDGFEFWCDNIRLTGV